MPESSKTARQEVSRLPHWKDSKEEDRNVGGDENKLREAIFDE